MSTADTATLGSNKKRRMEDRSRTQQSQKAKKDLINREFYDPDQDPDERREVKKGLRNLLSKVSDSRAEYLQSNSSGLVDTLLKADALYSNVKQTSDATIDSRLLVATADLSYKKIRTMTLGDSSVGIDVEDFISRCIQFMKSGTALEGTNTQSQRRRRQQQADDDEDENDGDAMNWAHLGRNACFLTNSRPCLSGFLLGPLSVQKKVRQQTQRRAREARADPSQAVRPTELRPEDVEKQESASLTRICSEIAALLDRTIERGGGTLTTEYNALSDQEKDNMPHRELKAMMRRHGVADNGCVPLFDFCINPKSFGQTVENMFYVSFLIKEGRAGLDFDSDGMPTLGRPEQQGVAEKHEAGVQRNQAIFTLNFDVWEDLVKSFGIGKSIIPHRDDDQVYDDGVIDTQALRGQQGGGARQEDEEDSDMYG